MIHLNEEMSKSMNPFIRAGAAFFPQTYLCSTLGDFYDNRHTCLPTRKFFSRHRGCAVIRINASVIYNEKEEDDSIAVLSDLNRSIETLFFVPLDERRERGLDDEMRLYRVFLKYHIANQTIALESFSTTGPLSPQGTGKKTFSFARNPVRVPV